MLRLPAEVDWYLSLMQLLWLLLPLLLLILFLVLLLFLFMFLFLLLLLLLPCWSLCLGREPHLNPGRKQRRILWLGLSLLLTLSRRVGRGAFPRRLPANQTCTLKQANGFPPGPLTVCPLLPSLPRRGFMYSLERAEPLLTKER
jgi:hypothetical protein